MKAKKTEMWKCSQCDELHETEDEAAYCCPPEEVEAWECGECGEKYEDRDEAKECCRD